MGGKFQVRYVFVIVLENESAAVTFAPSSPAPFWRRRFAPRARSCPTATASVTSQLTGVGDTWRSYDEDIGADPSRESATCGHPAIGSPDNTEVATPTDMYASRHDPFVYFHSIIDNAALCDSHVVNLDALPTDLSSVSTTRNYTFITPDLCNDGHNAPCADGEPGGLAQANTFLKTWVPKITASPAFWEDGLHRPGRRSHRRRPAVPVHHSGDRVREGVQPLHDARQRGEDLRAELPRVRRAAPFDVLRHRHLQAPLRPRATGHRHQGHDQADPRVLAAALQPALERVDRRRHAAGLV
jgi:hypothetical protein